MTYNIKSKSEYERLRRIEDKNRKTFELYRKKTGRNWSDKEAEKKYNISKSLSNDKKSAVEVYEFKKDKSKKPYFAYMKKDKKEITTWTGQKLGDVTYLGNEYSGGMGSRRQNFRMKGIDGREWSGTFYVSSGDYVRIKPVKEKK